MKLIELSCDQDSFHTIRFHSSGLTLILGDASQARDDDGNSNGVGKTLSLGLVHHCLGATVEPRLKRHLKEWIFALTFEHDGVEHRVERSGDGSILKLDGTPISTNKYRDWLNETGIFRARETVPGATFRSLIKRFARYAKEDRNDPVCLKKETPYTGLLLSMFLMGADLNAVVSKQGRKQALDQLKQTGRNWSTDQMLREVLNTGGKPELRLKKIEEELPRLQAQLDSFQVEVQYRDIEKSANGLTEGARQIDQQISICEYQIANIDQSIRNHPDLSKDELIGLYEGLQDAFKPEALRHFDAVEKFHASLQHNRRARLLEDRQQLSTQKAGLEARLAEIATERDRLLGLLQGKRALDEFAVVANQLARMQVEKDRLREFIDFSKKLKEHQQAIREVMVADDRVSEEYVDSEPLALLDTVYRKYAGRLYPERPAGITLENDTGENQTRYKLDISIEGQDSDGIGDARVLCFDAMLLTHGSRHSVDWLWHDNRLFAHLDPGVRAQWFVLINDILEGSDKQYIASLNTENFEAMKPDVGEPLWKKLTGRVILKLTGDKPENRLLGVQF